MKNLMLLTGVFTLLIFVQSLTSQPLRERGPGTMGRSGFGDTAFESTPPLPKDDAEKKILDVLKEMDQNQRGGMMNVPVGDGRLLRILTESVGAKHVVELGTSNGYSGI
jgi:caffeoyl-CoA O-methyltransferase